MQSAAVIIQEPGAQAWAQSDHPPDSARTQQHPPAHRHTVKTAAGHAHACSCRHHDRTFPASSMAMAMRVTMPVHWAPSTGGLALAYSMPPGVWTPKCRSSRFDRSLHGAALRSLLGSCLRGRQDRNQRACLCRALWAPAHLSWTCLQAVLLSTTPNIHKLKRLVHRSFSPGPRKAHASFTLAT